MIDCRLRPIRCHLGRKVLLMECPNCGSKSVTLWMGGRLGMIYLCKSCGYRGPAVLK